MQLLSNRLSTLQENLKKQHPKSKALKFLVDLETELAAIGDDTDSDLEEMEDRDKYDLQEHRKEIIGDKPLAFQQKAYRADQDVRIDVTHKKMLAEAPNLFLRTEKTKLTVNVKDFTAAGRTLLHKAAFKGDLAAVKNMIEEQGADPFIKDNSGQTAGELALEEEHMEVANYLATAMTKRRRK